MTTEPLLRLNSLAGDPRCDSPLAQNGLVLPRLISLVSVQFDRALAGTAFGPLDGLDGIQCLFEHRGVVDVRGGQENGKRDTFFVDNKMPLRSLFAAIRRILSGLFAPPGAGTIEASIAALVQSMRSAWPSRSRKTLCRRSQTPASCQSRRRRQQVIPEPQPIWGGSISQGMPVISTKRIPVNTSRLGICGRP